MWDFEEKERGEEEGEKVMDTTAALVKAYTQKRAKSLWEIRTMVVRKRQKPLEKSLPDEANTAFLGGGVLHAAKCVWLRLF